MGFWGFIKGEGIGLGGESNAKNIYIYIYI